MRTINYLDWTFSSKIVENHTVVPPSRNNKVIVKWIKLCAVNPVFMAKMLMRTLIELN